ncbi:peroxidase family protein, partial [Nocardioides sp.]|uniref:peroxidase family protein n=1 Tax=Nocardioides sp. TaxID=35761 RepID=UPI00286E116C
MSPIKQTFKSTPRRQRLGRKAYAVATLILIVAMISPLAQAPANAAGTVGQGFTVTASDLSFILKQIKIAEAHVANTTPATGPCGALVGTGPNQLSSPLLSLGLRTVDGSCNNLVPGKEKIGAADELFPRLTTATFKDAGAVPPGFGPPGSTSYSQTSGNVFDTEPRIISNLVVDQTSTNPAAIAAAGFPVRTQGNPGIQPCTTDPDPLANPPIAAVPVGCTPSYQTLFIPNVTTDVGLSPPYNSLFTLFGQFFDHGIDQTVKGGSGTVFVPLKDDDPLVAGKDHVFGNADDLDPNLRFMVLTRGTNQPGPDGVLGTTDDIRDVKNTDSPWVDQSQTYTSHASHQAFLREYSLNGANQPVSTGKLLGQFSLAPDTTDTGMATWASTKEQAATMLGLQLVDKDVLNVPMLAVDPYGNFIPGDLRGMPQYVTKGPDGKLGGGDDVLVEGDRANPVPVPSDVAYFDTPFLTDIAHNADPGKVGPCTTDIGVTPRVPTGCLSPDADTTASADFASQPAGTYDDEMLNAHFIAGDGRVNENIGLTTIHQVFHSEHDRLIDDVQATLDLPENAALKASYQAVSATTFDYGERIFQVARFVTEMEYQHLVFEEFARKVQPAINPFEPFAFTQPDLNPAIRAEFAHAVYRFGHSMLTETISRTNADGSSNDISLLKGFLNPPSYTNGGTAGTLN